MTTKPVKAQPDVHRLPPLPDPPPKDMQQHHHFVLPAVANTLAQHLGVLLPGSTTLVAGDGYLCPTRSAYPGCPHPDLVVAFNVDPANIIPSNGYIIDEVGKPPDLVLEVASQSTGRRDYTVKREIYARLGVVEYWRFDHSGGRYHNAPLSGDRLDSDGAYQPLEIDTASDGVIWGYSEALELSMCWVEGVFRLWDRAQRQYLPTPQDLAAERDSERQARANAEARLDSERQARADAEGRLDSERQARADAEARVRMLEEELRRRESP